MTTNKITATAAAALVGVTRGTIHRWIKDGILVPSETIGAQGIYLLDPEAVLDASHRRPGAIPVRPAEPASADLEDFCADVYLSLFPVFLSGVRGGPIDLPAEVEDHRLYHHIYVAGRISGKSA